jgi:hypothetical protein
MSQLHRNIQKFRRVYMPPRCQHLFSIISCRLANLLSQSIQSIQNLQTSKTHTQNIHPLTMAKRGNKNNTGGQVRTPFPTQNHHANIQKNQPPKFSCKHCGGNHRYSACPQRCSICGLHHEKSWDCSEEMIGNHNRFVNRPTYH